MSAQYNEMKTTGVTGAKYSSVIGKKEPLAHPCNCKTECPYGFGRAYCDAVFFVVNRLFSTPFSTNTGR